MEEKQEISAVFDDWEQILSHSATQPQVETQSSREWEMVVTGAGARESFYDDNDDDCTIFPPCNHEGLHISLRDDQHQDEEEEEEEVGRLLPAPESSTSLETESADFRLRFVGEVGLRWMSLGFEVLRSKFFRIRSSICSYIGTRRTIWSFGSAAGVAAALLLSLLYMVVWRWRWRRRIQPKRKNDGLIRLIQEKDEKITQLLHQIAQMNELLLARYRVPVLRSG